MMSDTETASVYLDVGRVLSKSFKALGQNFVPIAISTITLLGIPLVFVAVLSATQVADPSETSPLDRGSAVFTVLMTTFVMWLFSSFLHPFQIHLLWRYRMGLAADYGASLVTAVRCFFPVLITGVMVGLGTLGGFFLLIIPGVIVSIMWMVATPALVIEGLGPMAAIKRSQQLTKGARWPIFWMSVIIGLINVGANLVSGVIEQSANGDDLALYFPLIVSVSLSVLFLMVQLCWVVTTYIELRELKEGLGDSQLATVFE